MTEKAKELLSKFDHNLNGVLFDLVDENETLEGQVNELREQVARLTEKQNRKTVDVKLCGELIYRQAVLDSLKEHRALYCDNTPETFSKLSYAEKSRVDELDTAIATIINLPSVSVSENAIDKQIVLDMLEDINKETDGCGFEYKHWREYIDSLPTVNNLGNLSKCFDGMPNGKVMNLVLRKIFPRTIFIHWNDPCHKIKSINYSEEWENAPYKAEKER